jgi:DNA mismatch repair protein MutS
MEYPKEILVKDYFEIHNYYAKLYGSKTIILMQVGSFHEAYCTDSDGINLMELSQKLDICCTQKNGNNPVSKTNPRMMGFPIYVTHNFIDKLIELKYTVVLIDQVSEPPNPKRKVTNIYSPGTYIDKKTSQLSFIVSIILDTIKESKTNTDQLCIGLSAYDVSTGNGYIYETYSTSNDNFIGLDNSLRFLENYPPIEIIIDDNLKNKSIYNMNLEDILKYLNIDIDTVYKNKLTCHKKINWQINLLTNIYKIKSNVDIIELLGLQYYNWARISLVILLDYINGHQPYLVENIKVPVLYDTNKHLYLGNRSLEQLDVISSGNSKNLFIVINFTQTTIGKRYLINQLTMPLIDPVELNKRYNIIESLINNKNTENLSLYLTNIYDLDKLNRKLDINTIYPSELYQLYVSFTQIINLQEYIKNNNLLALFNITNDDLISSYNLKEWIDTRFNIDKINGLNFINFSECEFSIYRQNIHTEIDDLQNNIDIKQNFMIYLIKELEKYIDDKIYLKKQLESKNFITLKYNERDGHYLLLTSRRCEMLKKNLEKIKVINIGSVKLDISDLDFNELPKSTNTKISCKKIKEFSLELTKYKLLMAKYIKTFFKNDMIDFSNLYKKVIANWSLKIAFIDFINSGAICAIKNHYSKPNIVQKESSYFKAIELRHPLVEKINTKTNYIPHNIELGYETEQYGILLYGINSAGKSTLMKAIGLNIILVQIGYFACATNFEYTPYYSLFTRINGNDNIFKSLSSFMIEMTELMAILKRNNSNMLVIADELCHTTEELSANIIITYMLEILEKNKASFITATHLHKLAKLKAIINLKNVKIKHLKITYDEVNDILIYDRNLLDGEGQSFYGLQIAKYMMKDSYFNIRTSELLNEHNNKSCSKISKYNNQLYLEECEICKSKLKLETHHIIFQKDFNEMGLNKSKFYLQKNNLSNLVTLCSGCHDEIDRGNIIINGWKETSNGRIIDYNIITSAVKNKKYNNDIISFVNGTKEKANLDPKIARIIIKDNLNIKISSKTILSIWNNTY